MIVLVMMKYEMFSDNLAKLIKIEDSRPIIMSVDDVMNLNFCGVDACSSHGKNEGIMGNFPTICPIKGSKCIIVGFPFLILNTVLHKKLSLFFNL